MPIFVVYVYTTSVYMYMRSFKMSFYFSKKKTGFKKKYVARWQEKLGEWLSISQIFSFQYFLVCIAIILLNNILVYSCKYDS